MLPSSRRHGGRASAARVPEAATRRVLRASTLDGLFAAQYVTLTSGPLLAAFLLALGASPFAVGLAASLPLLGNLLQPVGAEVIRRRGGRRRPVALAAALTDALLWTVSVAAVAWRPAPEALVVVLGVLAAQQVPSAFVGVAWMSWISDLVPTSLRGRFFGNRNVIGNGFAALTALAAGYFVDAAADPLPRFLLVIGVGVAARFASIAFLYRHPEPQPARSVGGGTLAQFVPPLRDAAFRRYVAFSAAWGFAVQIAAPFFAVFMIREVGVGAGFVMAQTAASTAANLLGQRVWGPLADRYGEREVLRVLGLVIALQPMWWLFVGPSPGAQALMLVLGAMGGFAWGGYGLAAANLTMRLAPETGKTAFFGVQAAMAGAAGALGPVLGGVLAGAVVGGAFGAWLPQTLKAVFVVSAAARLAGLVLLARVPEPVGRPRLRLGLVVLNRARTFNPAQGFNPVLQAFTVAPARGLARRLGVVRRRLRAKGAPWARARPRAGKP